MSIRVDSSSWISGAIVVGHRGLGVLAENIPATGDAGPSFLFNDVTLPADAGKEICGRVTTWPTNGTLVVDETGSFLYTPFSDGADSFGYQLKVDGVDTGEPTTVSLQAGSPSTSFSVNAAPATFSGGASISGAPAFGAFAATLADATLSGGAQSRPVAAFSLTTANTMAAMSANTGSAIMTLTPADIAAIVAALNANGTLLTLRQFLALKD